MFPPPSTAVPQAGPTLAVSSGPTSAHSMAPPPWVSAMNVLPVPYASARRRWLELRGRRQWAFIGRGRDREGEGEREPEERSQTSTEERSVKVWNDGGKLREIYGSTTSAKAAFLRAEGELNKLRATTTSPPPPAATITTTIQCVGTEKFSAAIWPKPKYFLYKREKPEANIKIRKKPSPRPGLP